MKKTYKTPNTKVWAVNAQSALLAASATESIGAGFGGGTSEGDIKEADTKADKGAGIWDLYN